MNLFQRTIIQKHLVAQNAQVVETAWQAYSAVFLDAEHQARIQSMKESEYQDGFLRDLFVNVLGYTLNPDKNYNLKREQKNEGNAKQADGAIEINEKIVAVIELKDTKTKQLDKIEVQAFGYYNHQPHCKYVITANFAKLRFYIDNAVAFEEFDLFDLSRERFALLYLLLSYDSIVADLPYRMKDASVTAEEQITKQLYKDYSQFKSELFADLCQRNSGYEPIALYKKSQKLLDRFLFIFFAEDRLLLPENFIIRINSEWEDLVKKQRISVSLYERYKLYFKDLNEGNTVHLPVFSQTQRTHTRAIKIFAYNGGLFAPDEMLDNLQIDDELLYRHTEKLTKYDFDSDVDVNILGHIFENSLNDIAEVHQSLTGEIFGDIPKRKKDGVYYTPKYITQYMVDDTVGKLCRQQKNSLGINEEDYVYQTDDYQKNSTKLNKAGGTRQKPLIEKLKAYRQWLLKLTICDPACGSGAFLNQALDFLIEEHRSIDELEFSLTNSAMGIANIEMQILENNLYGVDVNEESVEIAKLALWLRTAKKDRKLNTLSGNIQCGNSLIEDRDIAGDRAFNWQTAFPQVFANGGFDVIIGNPPYLRIQGLQAAYPQMVSYYNQHFQSAVGGYDIYVLFMERCLDLINENGEIALILPHKFLISEFGQGIRGLLAQRQAVKSLVHFQHHQVFAVSTYTCIVNLTRSENQHIDFRYLTPKQIQQPFNFETLGCEQLSADKWNLLSQEKQAVFERLKQQPLTANDVFSRIFQGIATSCDKVYLIKGKQTGNSVIGYSQSLDKTVEIERDFVKPMLKGEDVKYYAPTDNQYFVIFPYVLKQGKAQLMSEAYIREHFPLGYQYLLDNEATIRGREKGRMDIEEGWFLYIYPKSLTSFEQQKIITPEISLGTNMTLDSHNRYHTTTVYSYVLKEPDSARYQFYLTILNSPLMWFYLVNTGTVLSGGFFRFKTKYLRPFPLPAFDENSPLMALADKALALHADLTSQSDNFLSYLQSNYPSEKSSKKLQSWSDLSPTDFLSELRKHVKKAKAEKLDKSEEIEWLTLFEEKKTAITAIKNQVTAVEKTINTHVYALYDLNAEEITVVEAALP